MTDNISTDNLIQNKSELGSQKSSHITIPVETPKTSKSKIISWQVFVFVATYLNYSVLHACRAVWSGAIPQIKLSHTWNAVVLFCFLFFYALGGIFSGHLADRMNKPNFIALAYLLIGIVVILLGLMHRVGASHNPWAFTIL